MFVRNTIGGARLETLLSIPPLHTLSSLHRSGLSLAPYVSISMGIIATLMLCVLLSVCRRIFIRNRRRPVDPATVSHASDAAPKGPGRVL